MAFEGSPATPTPEPLPQIDRVTGDQLQEHDVIQQLIEGEVKWVEIIDISNHGRDRTVTLQNNTSFETDSRDPDDTYTIKQRAA